MKTRYCVPYDRPDTDWTTTPLKVTGMVPVATAVTPLAACPLATSCFVGVAVPHGCTTYFTLPVSDKPTKTLIDVPEVLMLTDCMVGGVTSMVAAYEFHGVTCKLRRGSSSATTQSL